MYVESGCVITKFVSYFTLYGFGKGEVFSVRLTGYLASLVFSLCKRVCSPL